MRTLEEMVRTGALSVPEECEHERVSTGTREEARRGWHPGKCRHCGKDMSYDSGD